MAVLPTIAQVIQIGKVSIYLATNDNSKGILFGKRLNSPFSPVQIATCTNFLEWQYLDYPTDPTLRGTANYLIWMCGKYALEAQYILAGGAGGGAVVPSNNTIKSPIKITGADFATATEWHGVNSDNVNVRPNYTLEVFYNDVQRFLNEGDEWERTSTGINILISGFDAITYPDVILYIYISP